MHYFNIHFIMCVLQDIQWTKREKKLSERDRDVFQTVLYAILSRCISLFSLSSNDFIEFVVFPQMVFARPAKGISHLTIQMQ